MEGLDVTKLGRAERHPTIHRLLAELTAGQTLRISNDHDPRPLKHELDARFPGRYSWTYVESGPDRWRVEIGRVAAGASVPR